MSIRCIIVDDEPLAIKALSTLLGRFEEVEIIATCTDAFDAFDALKKVDADLMFLDINMPEISGLSFLKSLQNRPHVIFTTAHREYAFEAFELDVVDYLLKPVSYARLMKAMSKYNEITGTRMKDKEISTVSILEADHLFVRADRKMIKVLYNDILFIEGLKDYVKIITQDHTIITKMQMGSIETTLPRELFLRCHRSYIVNRQKVTAYTKYDIEIGDKEVPIGASYRDNVNAELKS